jgi:serine/threonine protein kinase
VLCVMFKVRLVGLCSSNSESLYLVYEYAENGSLSDCLHYQIAYPSSSFSRSVGLLSWKVRVQIALDVATGLEYLHNYTNPSLVHKDVKSSNILLDRNFRAKVANFGMAKSAEQDAPGPIMTEHIVGTHGYMAPEYLEHGLVTTKADVFSFGVVLLELLSGREPMVVNTATGQVTPLSATIFEVLSGGDQMPKLQAWMDSRLQNAYPRDIAYSTASLAKSCVEADPAVRPDMKDCSFALSKMCQASQDWDSSTRYTSAAVDPR